jgi:putative transposase
LTRTFRYQLRPSKTQERTLLAWLDMLRELYNAALQERRDASKKLKKNISRIDQEKSLPEVRDLRPEFGEIPISVLRGTLRTLDKSFRGFFRRYKAGKTPGYPRFKGKRRFNTIAIDDLGSYDLIVAGGRRIHVPLLGKVCFRQHRPLCGTPKSARISRDGNRWYVTIQCADVPTRLLPKTGREVGIDLGITSVVATSDGETFENPQALASARLDLERAQRRVSRRKRGSNRRRKAVAILAKKHTHVANVRREHAIQTARTLVQKYDTIYVEDLNIVGLARGRLAGPMNDAAWGVRLHWLNCKAEEAGREVVKVDPRGTSQECSGCGATVRKDLSARVHRCPACGLVIDRDVNAGRNVKARGRRARGGTAGSQHPTIREASGAASGVMAAGES